jgi:hypothetical protein
VAGACARTGDGANPLRALRFDVSHGVTLGLALCFALFFGIVLGGVFRAAEWSPHLDALVAWVRLHTTLRGAAFDVQSVVSMAMGDPVLLTSASQHRDVMAVLVAGAVGARRMWRRAA